MAQTLVKRYRPDGPGSARLEALGLEWLGAVPGGARAAIVHRQTATSLEIERFPTASPTLQAAEAFGRALARTHAAGASHFGAPPPGWEGPGWIGQAPMTFAQSAPTSWGEFYAAQRVMPYVRSALRNGSLTKAGAAVIERVAARLAGGRLDAPQPGLLAPAAAARLHGDLWAGNVLWLAQPPADQAGWTGAALIDPAAHGGHAETDLAMLALFGLAHLDRVVAAYDEVSPLADGWRDRVALHQIFPLLVHASLFGGSYGQAAVAAAQTCL